MNPKTDLNYFNLNCKADVSEYTQVTPNDIQSYIDPIVNAYNEGRKYKKLTNNLLNYIDKIAESTTAIICSTNELTSLDRFILGMYLASKAKSNILSIPVLEYTSNFHLLRISPFNYRMVVHYCKEVGNNIWISKHMVKSIRGQYELLNDTKLRLFQEMNKLSPIQIIAEPEHMIMCGVIYYYYGYNKIYNVFSNYIESPILSILLDKVDKVCT